MARYSTFKYGSGTKYGEEVSANLRWGLEIDWDGDGLFDGSNEAGRMREIIIRRGREQMLNEDATTLNRVRVGYASVILDDHDRRYDPYNSSSPLYPNVLPGRRVRIRVRDGSWVSSMARYSTFKYGSGTKYGESGTIYTLFTGRIANIRPLSGKERRVQLEIEDGVRWLKDRDVSISVQTSIDVDNAIAQVLTAAEYPTDWGSYLEDSTDIIRYWWTWSQMPAWEIICRLAEMGFGVAFVAADGKLKFYPRQHSTAAALTLTDDVLLDEIAMPQPWEVVRNAVEIVVHPTQLQSSGVIWTLQDKPAISAGSSLTVWAEYTYSNERVAAINVITPLPTTDYLANTAQDGSGTNLTSQFAVTIEKFSTVSKITYTNNSASAGYLIFAQLRGEAITSPDPVRLRADNTTSQAAYGKKLLSLDYDWQQNVNDASSLLSLIQDYLVEPRIFPTVRVEARPSVQFAMDLFDRVVYQSDYFGINDNYNVAYIEHQSLDDKMQVVRTTLALEPAVVVSDVYWQFPTQIGITSYFAP